MHYWSGVRKRQDKEPVMKTRPWVWDLRLSKRCSWRSKYSVTCHADWWHHVTFQKILSFKIFWLVVSVSEENHKIPQSNCQPWAQNLNLYLQNIKLTQYQRRCKCLSSLKKDNFDGTDLDDVFTVAFKSCFPRKRLTQGFISLTGSSKSCSILLSTFLPFLLRASK